jgi:alpha-L-rhamnosidase
MRRPVALSAVFLLAACGGSASHPNGNPPDAGPGPGADAAPVPAGPLAVTRTRTEYRDNPLGLETAVPRLDWLLESAIRDERQTAYQVLAASTRARLDADTGDLWDSGKVVSARSTQIEYAGSALHSRQQVFWKVRAWDKDDLPSAWSAPARFEMGLLAASDWSAKWISLPGPAFVGGLNWIWYPEGDPASSAPTGTRFFRRSFNLPAGAHVEHALALLTVDDAFDLYVNGQHVGAAADWRVVQSVDLGAHLAAGANTVAIAAQNGTSAASVLVQLQITLADGTQTVISGDSAWKTWNGSAPSGWQMPGFDDSSWVAAQVTAPLGGGPWGTPSIGTGTGGGGPARYLRRGFTIAHAVKKARLYATALGLYEASIDGVRVGTQRFAPGWTDYAKRLDYQVYDVTSALGAGDHVLGIVLGDGWYQGKIGLVGRGQYGAGPIRALAQLELELDDGSTQVITSDGSWTGAVGPIVAADLLDGESYDARLEVARWDAPGASAATQWAPVEVVTRSAPRLVAQADDGIQVQSEIAALTVTELHPGVFVYDLGQNMVGWTSLRVSGSAGAAIQLRFAEVLNPDGSIYTTNLRGAAATDRYLLRGGAAETHEPRFTTHGFRYVELSGDIGQLSARPDLATVTGIVAHAAMPVTGTLTTSEPYVNQLQSNIVWGQKGNFTAVPTDCPQRDERLGWMGDAQIFARTATLNMDVAAFFTRWTRDVDDAQYPNGAFADVSPRPIGFGPSGTPAWGDAGVIVPWTVYLAYGDTRILAEHFDAMAKWVDFISASNANHLWQVSRGSDYGDWLNIGAETDHEVLATAFYAHSADLVARAARVLGRAADATKYEALFAAIRAAFQHAYLSADGHIQSDTQTAYALALRFGLVPEAQRAAVGALLVGKIAQNGGYLNTGFLGVGHLLPALSSVGATATAYQLLGNRGFPSWRYEIDRGATTIWERWNGIKTDGTFEDPGMNSFNHYSFGAVDEWIYGTLAGIQQDEAYPGWTQFRLQPEPGGGLTHAHATFLSPQGMIVSDWTIENGTFTLHATIPVNAQARVRLPSASLVTLDGVPAGAPGADGAYALGSGSYVLTCAAP